MSHRTLIFVSNNDQGHAETTHALLSEIDDGILGSVLPGWDTLPLLEVDHPLLSDPRWASLGHLLKATWFTRGWCVQEAAFAKDGRLIWGQHELSWSQFMRVYTWMLRRAHQVIVKYELGMSTLHISAYSLAHKENVRALMPERFWDDIGNTLETFHEARSLGLTDPRDRIYAFTGLLTRDSLTNLKVIPDYRKSFPDVCTDLTLGFLGVHQNLDLLMYVQHTLSTLKTNFPSWVPLWNFSDTPHHDIESIHAGQPPIVDLEAPLAPSMNLRISNTVDQALGFNGELRVLHT
ncbi:hypothetical protein N0V83_005357 [Neocucurbitaria cava]|uniref:Heterokaryon incompatibility domain-containing protein n=1 Tax=Neocucurbitaria cava TaxID=798079 RepID=A0A9W9CLY4_9PLEO|nr:hypothetical protein N0V83_005357 [Neocucurbitaria cava]